MSRFRRTDRQAGARRRCVLRRGHGCALASAPAGALPTNAPKVGMVCTTGTAGVGTRTFNLTTGTGDIQTPDGNTVFMWSYADTHDPNTNLRAFQYPGPEPLREPGRDRHDQPAQRAAGAHVDRSSRARTWREHERRRSDGLFTRRGGASNGNVTYTFVAGQPGHLPLRERDQHRQAGRDGPVRRLHRSPGRSRRLGVQRGDGVQPAREEYILLLAEIDPDPAPRRRANQPFDFTTKHDRYFTVNGRSFPDTIMENGSALLPFQPYGALVRLRPTMPNEAPSLIRMLNAGSDNHPFHPHGNHTTQIAQDGRLVTPTEHFGETIGAGRPRTSRCAGTTRSTATTGTPPPTRCPRRSRTTGS